MLTEHLTQPALSARAREPISVLLVDDDEQYAGFVRSIFEETASLEITLGCVKSLCEVLPRLGAEPFSVILLDVDLPDGNGLEWLQRHGSTLQPAVIVLTSNPNYGLNDDTTAAAQDFIVKSEVQPEHLVRAVRYAADRERVRQQLVRSREYFQSLIEQARDLITVVDEGGVIVYQSPASTATLGRAPESLVGQRLASLVTEQDVPRLDGMLAALFEEDS